jgi:hypothetical protein
MTHATTFVSTLGRILEYIIDKSSKGQGERKFRVTLHRLARFDGLDVFQQITPYVGRVDSSAGFGRFFRVESGIVGLAARTGSLVVARKTNGQKFQRVWQLTQLKRSRAKSIKPYVDSLFACPFFAPDESNGDLHTLLVLFVDSADADFFTEEVLGTISAACGGFVLLLENLYRSGALRLVPSSHHGFRVLPASRLEALVSELKTLGVTFKSPIDHGWKKELTFETLNSLDLEVGRATRIEEFRMR